MVETAGIVLWLEAKSKVLIHEIALQVYSLQCMKKHEEDNMIWRRNSHSHPHSGIPGSNDLFLGTYHGQEEALKCKCHHQGWSI